jgi:FdhE protein
MDPARQEWLAAHPYLAQIAAFQARVEEAAASAAAAPVAAPDLGAYAEEYGQGVPLLRSERVRVDAVEPGAAVLERIVERLSEAPLPEALSGACRAIRDRFRGAPVEGARAVQWVLNGGGSEAPVEPGLLRYLGWTALARALAPVVEAFGRWRDEDRWLRAHCPTCGALPVQAQLVQADAGRERRLACGCCGTRWRFKRIGCPYCGNEAPGRIDVFEIEGEAGLRLDVCQDCKGYVKTVARERPPDLLLADWSTIHLDALAREKGFRRMGTSLYEL